jgi:CheY-like chemotaxis protein
VTRGSVLLVDDEPKIRQALTEALRDEGHDVVATGSPREALRLVTERPFDLLVVDNLMPELGGLEPSARSSRPPARASGRRF